MSDVAERMQALLIRLAELTSTGSDNSFIGDQASISEDQEMLAELHSIVAELEQEGIAK